MSADDTEHGQEVENVAGKAAGNETGNEIGDDPTQKLENDGWEEEATQGEVLIPAEEVIVTAELSESEKAHYKGLAQLKNEPIVCRKCGEVSVSIACPVHSVVVQVITIAGAGALGIDAQHKTMGQMREYFDVHAVWHEAVALKRGDLVLEMCGTCLVETIMKHEITHKP